MADIRVVVQVNALERIIIVDGKTEFIEETWWNDNIQPMLFPFWSSDKDRLIHLNYFSDGSYGVEKKKYIYDRATKERKWKTYEWREATDAEVADIAEKLKEKYFEHKDSAQETIAERLYDEYGRWQKTSWEGVRLVRNYLLSECDWTQMPDAQISDEVKAQWTAYRQKLRDIPSDYSGQGSDEVKYPINPTVYARYVQYQDTEGNTPYAGNAYLETDDQFGEFVPGVWDEYVKRVCLTIASNYRIKNPDEVVHGALKPADFSAQYPDERAELDALLAALNSNNV